MKTRQILNCWPTIKAMSDELGMEYERVRAWHSRERIAQDAWPAIITSKTGRRNRLTAGKLLDAYQKS